MQNRIDAMIFGSNGQDGRYLKALLEKEGKKVDCISRSGENIIGNICDYGFVEEQIKKKQPRYIFNFAALSTVRHSALFENHQTICTGTLNILESARLHSPDSKIFISGSALQFKNNGYPIDEHAPFEASSPYSVSRIQSVYAARYFRNTFGLQTYVGYFFHHDSPLRSEQHMSQKIVQTVKRIQSGSKEKLEVGNIDVRKEFNYALDVVEAIWILVKQDKIHEAVIGCGEAHSIKEWIENCFSKINKDWKEYVILKDNFVPDFDILVSNPLVLKSLGWKQKVNFHQLADIMMDSKESK
ncbi:MAG: GDP-mannose 4,6-dehydratase [Bacteroidota bacterium]|nr:GDP-mannose 4,6-dehydratase [Bacteroidota bacterium]